MEEAVRRLKCRLPKALETRLSRFCESCLEHWTVEMGHVPDRWVTSNVNLEEDTVEQAHPARECVHRSLQEPHTPNWPYLLPSLSPNSTLIFFPGSTLHFPCCLASGQWIGTLTTGLLDLHTSAELGFSLCFSDCYPLWPRLATQACFGHLRPLSSQTIWLYLRQELGPRLSLLALWSRMCPPT